MSEKHLIIWDFDGVIADSEHLWVKNWVDVIYELYRIKFNVEQQKYYLEGKADKTKVELLKPDFPQIDFNEKFWNKLIVGEDKLIASSLTITDNVENILQDKSYAQCVATGAKIEKHNKKINKLNLNEYFTSDNTFTSYMVEKGKPEPDIFIYAATKMGFKKNNCIIIEDSIVGIKAGKAADIPVIAYIGATGHNNILYKQNCIDAGANYIADNMNDVYNIIKHHFSK